MSSIGNNVSLLPNLLAHSAVGCSVAYLYDGTLEGLLSAVFLAYERHESPDDIVSAEYYQPRLGQIEIPVVTDYGRARRVQRGVVNAAGRNAFQAILRASTSECPTMGTTVLSFIRHVMSRPSNDRGNAVLDDLANPCVSHLVALSQRAVNECEKMRQFIRFTHLQNGVWYARCNPNANVIPLVMGYFSARLNDQAFIIYDERHHIAGIYNGNSWQLVKGDAVNVPASTDDEALYQEAWKRFYDTLSVDARYNPELRRHFMPVRLWQNLPEMQPRT